MALIKYLITFALGATAGAGGLALAQHFDLELPGREVTAKDALDRCVAALTRDNAGAAAFEGFARFIVGGMIEKVRKEKGVSYAEILARCERGELKLPKQKGKDAKVLE